MSEESLNQGNAQPTDDGNAASAGENREDVQVAEKTNVPSYEWHKRVVGDNRKLKGKLNETEAELERYRQAEMEAKGQHQALIDALRKENTELKSANQEKDQVFSWAKRTDAIRNVAKDMGCANTNHLLRHLEAENLLNEIETDDSYNANRDDVRRVVESIRANPEYDYLFKQAAHKADMVTPNATVEKKEPRKVEDLSKDEIAKLLANPSLQKDLLGTN
jgi:hypothetical protein